MRQTVVKIWMSIILTVFLTQIVQAQSPVQVNIQLIQKEVGYFYLGDLDFLKENTGQVIFFVTVANTGGEPVTGYLDFEINFIPAGGKLVAGGRLVHFWTNSFTVIPGQSGQINNLELVNGATPPFTTDRVIVDDSETDFNTLGPLEDYYRRTGKLMAGKYEFRVQFRSGQGNTNDVDEILIVRNPTMVHLSYPGMPVSNLSNADNFQSFVSTTPLFQWYSDATRFDLFIYEKRSTDRTVNDVFGHEEYAVIEDLTTTYFQYPATPGLYMGPDGSRSRDVVRPLEEGRTYYWYVEAKVATITPGEYDRIKSQVYGFTTTEPGTDVARNNRIMNALKTILGPGGEVILRRLTDFNPTGMILLNGEKISIEELEQMAMKVLQQDMLVRQVEVH